MTKMTNRVKSRLILSLRFVREPVRSRQRDTRTQKEILKEREMEEEEKEIKRAARKAEEKELIYQVFLSVPFTFLESRSCLAFPHFKRNFIVTEPPSECAANNF